MESKPLYDHYEFIDANKAVFEFNDDETKSLFKLQNLLDDLCERLKKKNFNGQNLKELNEVTSQNQAKEYLERFLIDEDTDYTLKRQDLLHLKAIAQKYKDDGMVSVTKIINDAIHGHISLHPLLVKILNVPEFQRLRHIKQTGILYYVFPSATHTRFEHSIGTSYIAGLLMQHLKTIQPMLNITVSDCLCIQIAALLHDCGHAPFSHLFEHVTEKLNISKWKHELASLAIVDRIYKKLENEFHSYGIFDDDLEFIKDLIYVPSVTKNTDYGKQLCNLMSLKKRGLDKSFMFEIVSNKRNGLDVDRFDYIERDCYQLSFRNNFDYKRHIKYSRVFKCEDGLNQICIRDKEYSNIYEMFHMREQLNRRAYHHETVSSIELMTIEAIYKADKFLKISDTINNLNIEEYLKWNDSIYWQILNSNDSSLAESQKIILNIESRNLYRFIAGTILNKSDNVESIKQNLFDFINDKLNQNNNFNISDICISVLRFNYGANDLNPIENVRFYNKYQLNKAFKIEKSQVSSMLLNVFEDTVLRLYTKNPDSLLRSLLYSEFYDWCKLKNYTAPYNGQITQSCNLAYE